MADESEDISFLRTEDHISLSCSLPSTGDRVVLNAQGLGNRHCGLEMKLASKEEPPDLAICIFILEQALSVRALQEMVSASSNDSGGQSGHRTLLYGHAVLLKHLHSSMYLTSLSTCSSNDKLAFDVGVTETCEGESCWWTIHPASKQRSEGEKVRVGDDLILVSVSTERYLHLAPPGTSVSVIASFQQTLWTVTPVSSGAIRSKSSGDIFGGDVVRIFHSDESLTIPDRQLATVEDPYNVIYESGAVTGHARSLWRIELCATKWTGGFQGFEIPIRIRHITSGRYLAVVEPEGAGPEIYLEHRTNVNEEKYTFYLRQSKDDKRITEIRDEEGMGQPGIKFSDTLVFLQHAATGYWLTYKTKEVKIRGMGRVEVKQGVMAVEGHMDDAVTIARAQVEEASAGRIIRKATAVLNRFMSVLDSIQTTPFTAVCNTWNNCQITVEQLILLLDDLGEYFAHPSEDEEHEAKQSHLRSLRNRQDLFHEEGMVALILDIIDKISLYNNSGHFAAAAGEEAGAAFDDIVDKLYLLLAAMIRGNRPNCAEFAQSKRLDWLISRLESQQASTGVLDVLHTILTDSPEALNMIKEKHIRSIISLLDRNGRDPKVLNILCSLCIGNDVAVRTNQNLICDNLLPGRDLLLQTALVDHVTSMRPNIFISLEGTATYSRWYYEVIVDHVERMTHEAPVFRVGWATTAGFVPFPGGGQGWGGNGCGDDLFSYAFDGTCLWTGAKPLPVRDETVGGFRKGDVIGCALDLSIPQITFWVNGLPVRGVFRDFNLDGCFYPVVSMSAKISCRFLLGPPHGRFRHGPPEAFSPMTEALLPSQTLAIEPVLNFGDIPKLVVFGCETPIEYLAFTPKPVDTTTVPVPIFLEPGISKLAQNIHEIWSQCKMEAGWLHAPELDEGERLHPCLVGFDQLPELEKEYDMTLAAETIRAILAFGFHITPIPVSDDDPLPRLKTIRLSNNYLNPNGYKPQPLDLSSIELTPKVEELIELLAENTHNVWANDRIHSGWTYGLVEDRIALRSPHLVPYNMVDTIIRRSNRDTAMESIKTILAHGFMIDPPHAGEAVDAVGKQLEEKPVANRTLRAETSFAVTAGKWYYEVELLTSGLILIGWASPASTAGTKVGADGNSFGFNPNMALKDGEPFGKAGAPGDVIGTLIDLDLNTISFTLNGEVLMDSSGSETAFRDIPNNGGYVPAITLGAGQRAKLNFGRDVNSLRCFTTYGLQEGYEPFQVNMTRDITLWYNKDLPVFDSGSQQDRLEIVRIPAGDSSPPALKVSSKSFGTLANVKTEYLRLSLPITVLEQSRANQSSKRSSISISQPVQDMTMMPRAEDDYGEMSPEPLPEPLPIITRNAQQYLEPEQEPLKDISPGVEDGAKDAGRSMFEPVDMAAEVDPFLESTEEYYYSLHVFPGQDLSKVNVGWVGPGFKFAAEHFDINNTRSSTVCSIDEEGYVQVSNERRECLVLNIGDLIQSVSQESKSISSGVTVGCIADLDAGILTFAINGRESPLKYQVECGTKLFPAVVIEPTSKELFQIELGRTKSTLPLSAAFFRSLNKSPIPMCPPRLEVQSLRLTSWSRVPNTTIRSSALKMSDTKGWSLLADDPVSFMAIYIPEEDRCYDILDLIEYQCLLNFHAHTLRLYGAVCSHGNNRVAHELTKHIDEKQLIYVIQAPYLSGTLRTAFYNLLIQIHLENHSTARTLTQNEFIIPLTEEAKNRKLTTEDSNFPSVSGGVSIRPGMDTNAGARPEFTETAGGAIFFPPAFPIDLLKEMVLDGLNDAVSKGTNHCRDPIGGSNANLFVPLLRVADHLLVMGVLEDREISMVLSLIDPNRFPGSELSGGLIHLPLDEAVKLQLCAVLQHLSDVKLRTRIESIVSFANGFIADAQGEQLQRYMDMKQAVMPPALIARKTREFRCPPTDQMKSLMNFRDEEEPLCPCSPTLQERILEFHKELLLNCGVVKEEEEEEAEEGPKTLKEQLLSLVASPCSSTPEDAVAEAVGPVEPEDPFRDLINETMVQWATENQIHDPSLVREMFSLIFRQYDALGEVSAAMEKAYVIGSASQADVNGLLKALGQIRALLAVQMSWDEEMLMKTRLNELMDNKVFYQHPDLMRVLSVHETVMAVMVNTLSKSSVTAGGDSDSDSAGPATDEAKSDSAEMVTACCRFLCYFCRTSRANQRAMFEHLGYLLDNSAMLLSQPSLRGSAPLDVAYSSLMDNNMLALALRESHLEKVTIYLSKCDLNSNQELIAKGYPDIGWDPVDGERYLDFLRFCVWVNCESIEENANLVIRLLIRRPECLGPALAGEGGGLLNAMKGGIKISQAIRIAKDPSQAALYHALNEGTPLDEVQIPEYNFSTLPEEDDDYIDMGDAVLTFYSVLVDLLGRCAPSEEAVKMGKSDSLRARAILRSLVSTVDLEGALSLRFILPSVGNEDGSSDMPPGLLPTHKAALVLFMDRVYGVPDQETFLRILENAFLPDMRTATTLDSASAETESDMALALNRYLGNAVLPLLVKYSHFFKDADSKNSLIDTTLHTAYRLSKCKSLTKGQREVASNFLLALTNELKAPMMTSLLRKLVNDIPALSEHTVVPLKVLTLHYERHSKYYGSEKGLFATATEEEKRLTMQLFTGIFDSLAQRAYDPDLFGNALPCLIAIGCALPPEYALTKADETLANMAPPVADGAYSPTPIDTRGIQLPNEFEELCSRFAEHLHDSWAVQRMMEDSSDPGLVPYMSLDNIERSHREAPVAEALKAVVALGWNLAFNGSTPHRTSSTSHGYYVPKPQDLKVITLTRETTALVERLAQNRHEIWASQKAAELAQLGGGVHLKLVPYDILIEFEKAEHKLFAQEFVRFIQADGYTLYGPDDDDLAPRNVGGSDGAGSSTEKRFAYNLLAKLLEYVDRAAYNIKAVKPGSRYTRRDSYSTSTEDVKFFGKVVLPLVGRYFTAHRLYLIGAGASAKEKEMVVLLFCKLGSLLRQKMTAFGSEVQISVQCMKTLVGAVDARTVANNSPEFIRASLLPYFNFAADDLTQVVTNLEKGKFTHVKGTYIRGATSLNYVHMVLMPTLTAMFDHLGLVEQGADLLVGEVQVACYRILNALYTLATKGAAFSASSKVLKEELERHLPALGSCLAAFATCFPVAFLEPSLNVNNKDSIMFGLGEEGLAEHSLEAQAVMENLAATFTGLDPVIASIKSLAVNFSYSDAPHIVEVTLPMVCAYLPNWWSRGPDSSPEGPRVTDVVASQMCEILGDITKLVTNNVGSEVAPWMTRIATCTQTIIGNTTPDLLAAIFTPVVNTAAASALDILKEEEAIKGKSDAEAEQAIADRYALLVRDIYAIFPLLIKYVDLHRGFWLKNPIPEAEKVYTLVSDIFEVWVQSQFFKREEQGFVARNEIDSMTLIMPSTSKRGGGAQAVTPAEDEDSGGGTELQNLKRRGQYKKKLERIASLNVACLKRLLPIGMNLFTGREQEIIQYTKEKFLLDKPEEEITEFVKTSLEEDESVIPTDEKAWQKMLYKQIGGEHLAGIEDLAGRAVERIYTMAKILSAIHKVEHPAANQKGAWKKLISSQRKRAVMACFRMCALHSLPRHRAINLFILSYKDKFLDLEESAKSKLIEDLATSTGEEGGEEGEVAAVVKFDPLTQLVNCFSMAATTETTTLEEDPLYITYADILATSCGGGAEEEEEEEGLSFEEQEMQKQKLLFEQSRCSERNVAKLVLLYISSCKGIQTPMLEKTLNLGISILKGGNVEVQKLMLEHLCDKKDVGFFTSIAGLMSAASVLDLDAFERTNKAENLGTGGDGAGEKNLHDADFTCSIFRFLQLLAEGHNDDFQNYLRTQSGNTSSINLIICTVDYLLRLQESIMDFYWHYASKETIDPAGQETLTRALNVASQVFNTITEVIQGPCVGNQLALTHSRLWDAIGGFLYLFAHMQDKLSRDANQMDLLTDLLNLQKDMMVMLLSMLEGNILNGPIGKQMVDTLMESQVSLEMILKFFDTFLKLANLTSSEAFMEIDLNGDGFVSPKELRSALVNEKTFTSEEIEYILLCVDANQDGKIDITEFTERFHNPAKEIGFNVALLLTNLSEHITNDARLDRFVKNASSFLNYFEPYLGRIEILGKAGRIERVYFEITEANIDQWEKPQIKESKRAYIFSSVNEGGDGFDEFINFAEDTIFEMQHAASISTEEEEEQARMSEALARAYGDGEEDKPESLVDKAKGYVTLVLTQVLWFLCLFTPSSLLAGYRTLRSMTPLEIFVAILKLFGQIALLTLTVGFTIVVTLIRFVLFMMKGMEKKEEIPPTAPILTKPPTMEVPESGFVGGGEGGPIQAFGIDISKEGDGRMAISADEATRAAMVAAAWSNAAGYKMSMPEKPETPSDTADPESSAPAPPELPQGKDRLQKFCCMLARNFYTMKNTALIMAFIINFILLFYRVVELGGDGGGEEAEEAADTSVAAGGEEGGEEEEDKEEIIQIKDDFYYLEPILRLIMLTHTLLSFCLLIGYYYLKVPLIIFKREKEISRLMEFEGQWITEKPSEDDLRGHWDGLVISSPSFPLNYWDKFVKKKVISRYAEDVEEDALNSLLGLDKGESNDFDKPKKKKSEGAFAWIEETDWRYQIWKGGVIFTDMSFLYIFWYFVFSFIGNFSFFFFAAHLLDIAVGIKDLGTILRSVTHNGKSLLLTTGFLTIVCYCYAVIAFTFFRRMYVQEDEESGEQDAKCHDMLQCFKFHLYSGVRAGGGIGDELDAPYGDPLEYWRMIFDYSFFLFVIIILLAIIQGLIIDAFGELRGQLEQVKEDMESKCFICGIGADYFDKTPHGFETHTMKEHNFANYLFFMMHLINKPDTEYTGQETYVWEMYQQRCWDFFPVGDCFRKQYEDELG